MGIEVANGEESFIYGVGVNERFIGDSWLPDIVSVRAACSITGSVSFMSSTWNRVAKSNRDLPEGIATQRHVYSPPWTFLLL